jgi:hypothetical protein
MQEDVAFKIKVQSGGFAVTQMAVKKQVSETGNDQASLTGISRERLDRFKRAFEAKWLKEKLDKEKNLNSMERFS